MSCICKVGGSLLDFASLPEALDQWVGRRSPEPVVLIAGGGSVADQVRRFDRRFSLPDDVGHWLAVRAMSVTARLLAHLVSGAERLDEFGALERFAAAADPRVAVFDVESFLRNVESGVPGFALPRDWTATSDSIAARVAQAVGARHFVLLKSAPPPSTKLADCAQSGYVDGCFQRAAAALHDIRAVNLRSPDFAEWQLA